MENFETLDLEEGFGDSGVNSSRCLVGKVVHGKAIKAPVFANILNVAWRTRAPFHVDDWSNNTFLFRFEDMEDKSNILREGPWSVMGNILVLILFGTVSSSEEEEILAVTGGFLSNMRNYPISYTHVEGGHDNLGCRFISRQDVENSGYGPELRTRCARRSVIPVEFFQTAGEEEEDQAENLNHHRPEVQIQGNRARVVTVPEVGVTSYNCTVNQQETVLVGGQHAPSVQSNGTMKRIGVAQLRMTGVFPSDAVSGNQACQTRRANRGALSNRSPSRNKKVTAESQDFDEEGLCNIEIQQWFGDTGMTLNSVAEGMNYNAMSNDDPNISDLAVVMFDINGRVAGPEQPQSQC
ncbi:hypothetical protein Vadar_013244 [Vaccinium darrowii]|uniref:Uncharacterized protein n=1 Tax=Vaccinium darrowii TaxID=229202 RepID=A0ACB7X0E2_9ERIC|nr:hypothetical protein Vadar_013244 [Vaccinium darrowii]